MARLTQNEKEAAYRAIAIFSDVYLDCNDFTHEERKSLESARLKMRKELKGFDMLRIITLHNDGSQTNETVEAPGFISLELAVRNREIKSFTVTLA